MCVCVCVCMCMRANLDTNLDQEYSWINKQTCIIV